MRRFPFPLITAQHLSAICRLYAICCGFCFTDMAYATDLDKHPFSVIDSVEWTSVSNFLSNGKFGNPISGTALFSPDRSKFILHTIRGDLHKNLNVESLLLFNTPEVEQWLGLPTYGAAPAPVLVAQREIDDGDGNSGLESISWMNESEIGFMAPDEHGVRQAFIVDTTVNRLSQVTHSETPIVSFAGNSDKLLYFARSKRDHESKQWAYPISDKMITTVLFDGGSDPDTTPVELFQISRATGAVTRVDMPRMELFQPPFYRIWMSPRGDYAVIMTPSVDAPDYWADYKIADFERLGYGPNSRRSDPTSYDLFPRNRYTLVDLARNTIKPLLDAPGGAIAQNLTVREVFWVNGGKSVVVSNTYLPLKTHDARVREMRRERPAIAEVDLLSGEINTVFWEPVRSAEDLAQGRRQPFAIQAIDWDQRSQTLTLTERRKNHVTGENTFSSVALRKIGGRWLTAEGRAMGDTARLLIVERQGLNERPKIYASAAGVMRVLFDPDPQADQLLFGRVEPLTWRDDGNGIEWKGGLVYPPDYKQGEKYPLVVQTHGFDADKFLLNGPGDVVRSGTAMSAQALANAGFLVLQVEDNGAALVADGREGERFADGLRLGIGKLVSEGIVDPAEIGLITFSRTCLHAVNLLAKYPELLLAADLSDGVTAGYLGQLLTVNDGNANDTQQLATLGGVVPEMSQLPDWFGRNPLYKVFRARTAVRLEALGEGSALGMWEIFSILRMAKRPVDLIYFPYGDHNLGRPAEQLASRGGNVDWFRFWLKGEEDPDPGKVDQYIRWRALRVARESSN